MPVDLNKPLTAETMWQDYLDLRGRSRLIKPDTPPAVLAELRILFYSGLYAMLHTLPPKLASSTLTSANELIAKLSSDIREVLMGDEK